MDTMHLLAIVDIVVALIAALVFGVSNKPKTQGAALLTMVATVVVMAVLFFIMPAPAHAADLTPRMFPSSEARLLEQELANEGVKREVLPTKAQAIRLGYGCEDYDQKIERLIKLYDQLNRVEMARQWRVHLGHVWEFSLNFCEDVEQHHDRYQVAFRLYQGAGDSMRARRVATKEADRLRRLERGGKCDEMGNCRSALVMKATMWDHLATK